jgi:hypothetical protein
MKEEAPKIIYRAYVDYGIVVIVALAGIVAVWILLKYIRTIHEKQVAELKTERDLYRKEFQGYKQIVDHNSDVVSDNSRAQYEAASVVNEVKGILIILNDKLK